MNAFLLVPLLLSTGSVLGNEYKECDPGAKSAATLSGASLKVEAGSGPHADMTGVYFGGYTEGGKPLGCAALSINVDGEGWEGQFATNSLKHGHYNEQMRRMDLCQGGRICFNYGRARYDLRREGDALVGTSAVSGRTVQVTLNKLSPEEIAGLQ